MKSEFSDRMITENVIQVGQYSKIEYGVCFYFLWCFSKKKTTSFAHEVNKPIAVETSFVS